MKYTFKFLSVFLDTKSKDRPLFNYSGASLVYLFIQMFNFLFFCALLMVFYEICLGISILLGEYFFSVAKFSIIYIFIYFLVCLFNIRYIGYHQFKFFGMLLNGSNLFLSRYFMIIREYNYFFLIMIHIFLLNLVIYTAHTNIIILWYIILFYMFIFISIKVKIKWDNLDLNYKTKVWNLGFNLVLILIIGFYINLIIEYLVPSFFLKISGFDYFWKTFQNKSIFNFSYERSDLRWFNMYSLKKEYLINTYFFNFKKNMNNQYILYNYNSIQKSNLPILKKDYDTTILSYINYNNNNLLLLQEKINLEKASVQNINSSENNINVNESYNSSFYKDYDINKITGYEKNIYNIFNIFSYKNFVYNRLNFIIQSHLENKDTYPLEENTYVLKNLLKKDPLNYNYLLLEENNKNMKLYENYLSLAKKKVIFYNNIYDLLLKSDWKALNFPANSHNKEFLYNLKTQYTSLLDFNKLINLNTNKINLLKSKIDLVILNSENKQQVQIKNDLIKEAYTPNNFNVKKVIKNMLLSIKNNNKSYLVDYSIEKAKSVAYFNTDDFLDFIELTFDKALNNKIFKSSLFNNFVSDEFEYSNQKSNIDNKLYLNALKKQMEEFSYKMYAKRIYLTIKDLEDILNMSYILGDEIYEIDVMKNKINIITFNEYQKRLNNIALYEKMINFKEVTFKQLILNKLESSYFHFLQKANKYFPMKIYKNYLVQKMINYYENKLILLNKKDKFLALNNMEKIIYFFNHKSTLLSPEEHKQFLSPYNIQKISMSYLRYNNIKAYYTFLYDYEGPNNTLYRHLMFQKLNEDALSNIFMDFDTNNIIIDKEIELKKIDKVYDETTSKTEDSVEYIISDDPEAQLVIKKKGLVTTKSNIITIPIKEDEFMGEAIKEFILMYKKGMTNDEWLNNVKEILLEKSHSVVLKNPILIELMKEQKLNNEQLDDSEVNIVNFVINLNTHYTSLAQEEEILHDAMTTEVVKHYSFFKRYATFIAESKLFYANKMDPELFDYRWSDYMASYNEWLSDPEYIENITEMFYDKEVSNDFLKYINLIYYYNVDIINLQNYSQSLQLQIESFNQMGDAIEKIFVNRSLQKNFINDLYDQYLYEIEEFLEVLKISKEEFFANKQCNEAHTLYEDANKEYELILAKHNDLVGQKHNEIIKLQNKTKIYYNNILKKYPNIKYKNLEDLDKALKNTDWELYRLQRLNNEYWNKFFKNYNKNYNTSFNKKPYGFGK
jgi:hypothetical protein